jgi:hypothetical protein
MSLPPESGETPPRRRIGDVLAGFASPNPAVPGGHNVVDAVDFLRQKASLGDAEAQFQLAVIYQNGRLVPQDQEQARDWLLQAAAQGHVKAMFNLGVTYGDGLGVPVNDAEAFKWYQAAANEGDPRAFFNLGSFYIDGRGTPIDGPKANEHWFEAALRGLSLAQVRLALSFARGDGGKVDHQLAFIWAYVSKDKEANARVILDAVTQAISPEEVAALEREAHGVMYEMKYIDPNDKRRFSQGDEP